MAWLGKKKVEFPFSITSVILWYISCLRVTKCTNTFWVQRSSQSTVVLLLTPSQKHRRASSPEPGAALLSVWWRIWHPCCPHNASQCESCSNYDSFRWMTGENWTWIFHNLHLFFKWETVLESHAIFCHGPEFPITVIGKVSEGALKMRDEMISANANYQTLPLYQLLRLHYCR